MIKWRPTPKINTETRKIYKYKFIVSEDRENSGKLVEK
jgi:hypothetical protein